MKTQLVEIADGKFIPLGKIISCNIYQKDATSPWRVGFVMDTQNKEESKQFSKPFNTKDEARMFIESMNNN